jgi:hypothetical protein
MSESIWYCQKCGNKNDKLNCPNCGGPKFTEGNFNGIKYHIWTIVDFVLVEFLIMVLAKAMPSFGDVFNQYGAKLPWLTSIVCQLGYFLEPYGRGLATAVGCFGGLFLFTPRIKKKVEFKYLIYLFLLLVVLLIILLIGMFSPMFCLDGPTK